MRKTLAVVLALIVACGGETTAPKPKGTLVVTLSAQTCTGSDNVDIFIDGTSQGRQPMSAGQSRNFTLDAGQYLLGANAQNSGLSWPPLSIFVPANGTFTRILDC